MAVFLFVQLLWVALQRGIFRKGISKRNQYLRAFRLRLTTFHPFVRGYCAKVSNNSFISPPAGYKIGQVQPCLRYSFTQ